MYARTFYTQKYSVVDTNPVGLMTETIATVLIQVCLQFTDFIFEVLIVSYVRHHFTLIGSYLTLQKIRLRSLRILEYVFIKLREKALFDFLSHVLEPMTLWTVNQR